ncbi:hypothetical protein L209DRAFT_103669 [Thermothelomyces heterothallicus CBS 203.75]
METKHRRVHLSATAPRFRIMKIWEHRAQPKVSWPDMTPKHLSHARPPRLLCAAQEKQSCRRHQKLGAEVNSPNVIMSHGLLIRGNRRVLNAASSDGRPLSRLSPSGQRRPDFLIQRILRSSNPRAFLPSDRPASSSASRAAARPQGNAEVEVVLRELPCEPPGDGSRLRVGKCSLVRMNR